MNDTTKHPERSDSPKGAGRRVSDETLAIRLSNVPVGASWRDVLLDLRDERATHAETLDSLRRARNESSALRAGLEDTAAERDALKAALAALVEMVTNHVRADESHNPDLFAALTAAREVSK